MNWKIFIGILLIFGALNELFSVISDYTSGKLRFWPFGIEIGLAALGILGIFLIQKGRKQKRKSVW